ncbi:MAG: hypothetical protein AMJ64_08665 [Betaproteobacteria bacterium SG8_39]|nr:MAG: hypothetical protein AMJ64_08665 [Betaproteobacteria bacterium SG8_39]
MAAAPTDRKRMIAEYRMLSTANVSDGLDRLAIKGCPHGIGPLWDGCAKIVGPAATLKLVPVGEAEESPVLGTLEAVKRGHPGDVLVIDQAGAWTSTATAAWPALPRAISASSAASSTA